MTKHINLFHEDMVPGFGPVQLQTFVFNLIIAFAIGGSWFYLAWNERQQLLTDEQHWLQILQENTDKLASFQARYPKLNSETALRTENQRLLSELQRARETDAGLASQFERSSDGFYRPLSQLADYDLEGLWLNNITLQEGTHYFLLSGYTKDPAIIPLYINKLGRTDFGNLSISQLKMTKTEQNLWSFTLSNQQQTQAADQ